MNYSEAEIRRLFENYTNESFVRDLIYTTHQSSIFKVDSKLYSDRDEYPLLVLNPGISRDIILSIDFTECQILEICAVARTVRNLEFIEFFMNFKDPMIRFAVALNPKTPIKILTQLADDEKIRPAVASNISIPAEMLEKLAHDEKLEVRIAVAFNPSTPINVLKEFTRDEEKVLRAITSINISASNDLLVALSKDKEVWVREMVARNISTPIEVFEKLAKDEDEIVREKVANNISTPVYLLEKLASDKSEYVPEMLGENVSTPTELLKVLGKDKKVSVRMRVALNPSAPGEVLEKLAEDEDEEIRQIVALNPSTPGEVLEKLAEDEELKELVVSNRATPVEVLRRLSEGSADEEERRGIDQSNHNLGHKLFYEFNNRNLGIEYIQKAAKNGEPKALYSLIWINIIDDDIKLAISNFEKYVIKSDDWIKNEESRVSKMDSVDKDDIPSYIEHYRSTTVNSNAALAYYADNQKSKAKELWEESNKISKNLETMVFKTLLINENDSNSDLDELTNMLNKDDLFEMISEWGSSLEKSSITGTLSTILSQILPRLGALVPKYEEAIIPEHDLDLFEENLKKVFPKYLEVRKGESDHRWDFLYLGSCELYCLIEPDKGNVLFVTVVLSNIEESDITEINTYLNENESYETWFAREQENGLTQIIYGRIVPLDNLLEIEDIETELSIAASYSNNFLTLNLQNTFGGTTSSISEIPWHKYFKHIFGEDFLNELGIK